MNFVELIAEIWPKQLSKLEKDRIASLVATQADFDKLKNQIEITLEDTCGSRLPSMVVLLGRVFGTQPRNTPAPVVPCATVLVQTPDDTAALEKEFYSLWEAWPDSIGFIETHRPALAAFLGAVRTHTLQNVKKACIAYSDAFNAMSDGMAFPKSMKGFLTDRELLLSWLERADGDLAFGDFDRKQFEAAYAWYPDFASKKSEKTKKIAMVSWWRKIRKESRLDFLVMCKWYREERIRQKYEQDLTDEQCLTFTKGFAGFVGDWRDVCENGVSLRECKRDFLYSSVVRAAMDNGVDLLNVYSSDLGDLFFDRVFPFLLDKLETICQTVNEMLVQFKIAVADAEAGKIRVKDLLLARSQSHHLDISKVSNNIMEQLIQQKSAEMPKWDGV